MEVQAKTKSISELTDLLPKVLKYVYTDIDETDMVELLKNITKYTIVEEHLASKSSEYRGLSAGKYIERAEKVSGELADVMRHIFYDSNMPAETHYRTCDGLLNLQRSSDPVIFRTACETALRYERYSYRFIRSLVESKCAGVTQAECLFSPPEHVNIRGREQFK